MAVRTYKGLSHRLFLFGVQPVDAAAVCLAAVLTWMFTLMALPTVFIAAFAYYALRRLKYIDMDTRLIFIRFILTPSRIGLRPDELPGYNTCLK
mgnify:CR=1 FL=1